MLSDLNNIVQDVRSQLKETLEEKAAILEVCDLPRLNVIPFQFHQLLVNLLSNALKFSKKTIPPKITIQSEIVKHYQIPQLKVAVSKIYHHISISDNGIGFDPQYGGRIFDIFQRLHNRQEYEGTGVGLAICKKIIENHGGLITADGMINEGAIFHVYLPANEQ